MIWDERLGTRPKKVSYIRVIEGSWSAAGISFLIAHWTDGHVTILPHPEPNRSLSMILTWERDGLLKHLAARAESGDGRTEAERAILERLVKEAALRRLGG